MSKSDIAVSVKGLSKSYTIVHNQEKERDLAVAMLKRLRNPFHRPAKETFWALKDVSFDIKKGDVVGIIGRNGAGKSTLLKILSRITQPTIGRIELYGRVGSLLEVGTGFHPELTGRENIFLNGSILGMARIEILKQLDAIVDFSGIEKFLDTPVKRYSSGMYVRLAFAVAAHLEPEILIVDEVLAVGDAEFQKRCLGKMREVSRDYGRTVILVSHNTGAIASLCSSCLVLHKGELKIAATSQEAISYYLRPENQIYTAVPGARLLQHSAYIKDLRVRAYQHDTYVTVVDCRQPFVLKFSFFVADRVLDARHFFMLTNEIGEVIFGSSDVDAQPDRYQALLAQSQIAEVTIPGGILKSGRISVTFGADVKQSRVLALFDFAAELEVIDISNDLHSERNRRSGVLAPILNWHYSSSIDDHRPPNLGD